MFFVKIVSSLKCLENKRDKKPKMLIFANNSSLVDSRRLWYYVCVVLQLLINRFYLSCLREDIVLNTGWIIIDRPKQVLGEFLVRVSIYWLQIPHKLPRTWTRPSAGRRLHGD